MSRGRHPPRQRGSPDRGSQGGGRPIVQSPIVQFFSTGLGRMLSRVVLLKPKPQQPKGSRVSLGAPLVTAGGRRWEGVFRFRHGSLVQEASTLVRAMRLPSTPIAQEYPPYPPYAFASTCDGNGAMFVLVHS